MAPGDTDAPSHDTLHIASEEVEEKFQQKLKAIETKEREHDTEESARRSGFPYINLRGFPIESETLAYIAEATARVVRAVCFFRSRGELRIAAVEPNAPAVVALRHELEALHRTHTTMYLISESSFEWALKLYGSVVTTRKTDRGSLEINAGLLASFQEQLKSLTELTEKLRGASATDVVAFILAGALKARASDVHIETEKDAVKLRYRIDGVLQTAASIASNEWSKVVSRIKLLSGLKLNVDHEPQDGRMSIVMGNESVDVRVSTLPSSYGESVVLRLLMSATAGIKFEDIGLRGRAFDVLEREMHRPNGMIITTGPTSSGKTTTLYAILNRLNTPERKIITLEDPVEYRLLGVNQSQIDYSRGYTFSKGLKAIMRQNPDIIMVGEIRDPETAEIAIHAALTGHMVLSTLHTNDAAGAIPRFLAMGVKSYLLSPALNAVIAQRLVRRICDTCTTEEELPAPIRERVNAILQTIPEASGARVDVGTLKFFRGKGCDACHGLGLKGRVGIYEVLVMTEEIQKLIQADNVAEAVMRETAVKNGMITMVQDGLLKAADGITTVDEVFRVAAER